jgi:hypothetical protein
MSEEEDDDWEENNNFQETQTGRVIDLNPPSALVPKKRKRRATETAAAKQSHRDNDRQHLRASLDHALLIASCSYDEEVLVTCLSMLPSELIDTAATITQDHLPFLQLFQHWFRSNYEIIKSSDLTIEEGRDGSPREDLLRILRKSVGSPHQLCQIAIAFLTSLNFEVHYAVTIDLESSTSSVVPSSWIEVWIPSSSSRSLDPLPPAPAPPSPSPSQISPSQDGKWFCLELSKNILSSNKKIIEMECRARRSSVGYVLSVDRRGHVEDVTFLYASHPVRTRAKRLNRQEDQRWWTDLLSSKNNLHSTSPIGPPSSESEETSAMMKSLPQSISGYRNHPYYALAGTDHLGKRQILHPEAKRVALFAGHSVYLRKDISELKTRLQWKKMNREILPNELPIRSLEPPVSGPSSSSSSSAALGSSTDLFAEYQTRERPPLEMTIDSFGRKQIPRNKHGNIELWDGKTDSLPRGCAYLSSSSAAEAAQLLGLAHVPAIVGFKSIGVMKYAPALQGVVILEEDYELVSEAALAIEAQAMEEEQEKKYLKIMKKWHRLCRLMLSRVRLFEEYGH